MSVELHTSTAWISGSRRTSRASAVSFSTPRPLAHPSSWGATTSATDLMRTPGIDCRMFSACSLPIRPAPMIPTTSCFMWTSTDCEL